ncbi:MAG: bifunctional (p)ppGpp synthetase/guanosine-3',5'-bis(diphosphate) 3'-pyrophosphohydrolase, partial [Dethiobacter sp.]|nr:bifunctional (p)ppGpp synthetase/guanosine-3',5'-bis(diphosphate) 3'-pyrophosphohydrolase [Dethiobacter sp.]
ITPPQAVMRLKEEYRKKHGQSEQEPIKEFKPQKPGKTGKGVRIAGIDNLLLRFAKCCTPVPGDEILGVVTRGRGVSVHRWDCPNVQGRGDSQRFLEAVWEESDGAYPVEIEVSAMDRPHILMEVVNAVSECKVNITAVNGKSTKNKMSIIQMTVMVRDRGHLESVLKRVNAIRDVFHVYRLGG